MDSVEAAVHRLGNDLARRDGSGRDELRGLDDKMDELARSFSTRADQATRDREAKDAAIHAKIDGLTEKYITRMELNAIKQSFALLTAVITVGVTLIGKFWR